MKISRLKKLLLLVLLVSLTAGCPLPETTDDDPPSVVLVSSVIEGDIIVNQAKKENMNYYVIAETHPNTLLVSGPWADVSSTTQFYRAYNPPNGTYRIFAGVGSDLQHIIFLGYYPSGISAGTAIPITIQDGVGLTNIDMTLQSVH